LTLPHARTLRGGVRYIYIGFAADGGFMSVNQLRLKLELGRRVDYFTNYFLPK